MTLKEDRAFKREIINNLLINGLNYIDVGRTNKKDLVLVYAAFVETAEEIKNLLNEHFLEIEETIK